MFPPSTKKVTEGLMGPLSELNEAKVIDEILTSAEVAGVADLSSSGRARTGDATALPGRYRDPWFTLPTTPAWTPHKSQSSRHPECLTKPFPQSSTLREGAFSSRVKCVIGFRSPSSTPTPISPDVPLDPPTPSSATHPMHRRDVPPAE